jgi:methionine-rich copper-binding protein CopC
MRHGAAARERASWSRRLCWSVGVAILLMLVMSGPAEAHGALVSSNPEDGSSIDVLPDEVSFTFDEDVATPAFVAVTAPDGTNVTKGDPIVNGDTVTQAVRPLGGKGTYTMSYRVVSADGHPVSATLTFDVTSGAEVTPPTDPPPVSGSSGGQSDRSDGSFFSSHSVEALVAIVVVVLGLGLLIFSGTSARARNIPHE